MCCLSLRFIRTAWLLVLVLGWPAPVVAAAELYRARVSVADHSEAERHAGFQAALATVLVKLTGQRHMMEDPRLAALLDAPGEWVAEYRYGVSESTGALREEQLVVDFAPAALDAELRRLGVARWPASRPAVLIWLQGPDATRRPLEAKVSAILQERGLTGLAPLWDLQDQLALGMAGGLDPGRVMAATTRYETAVWLILEPRQTAAGIQGAWSVGGDVPSLSGESKADDWEGWVVASAHAAVDALAARQSYLPGGDAAKQRLRVEGIGDYVVYQQVVAALGALDSVRGLQVEQMTPAGVTFVLALEGDVELLWNALARDGRFTPIAQLGADAEAPPVYVWRQP